MQLDAIAMVVGTACGLLLPLALLAGLAKRPWRIWPAPPGRSWGAWSLWSLFRALNVCVLAVAISALGPQLFAGTLSPIQMCLLAISVVLFLVYSRSLWSLGRQATYCQASGLETRGVYRVSRNPQYATAIAAFAALGGATYEPAAMLLSTSLLAAYALMALSEEAWLEDRYGNDYREYRNEVPRFFGLQHSVQLVFATLAQQRRRQADISAKSGA